MALKISRFPESWAFGGVRGHFRRLIILATALI
jgi:hypothetical protein